MNPDTEKQKATARPPIGRVAVIGGGIGGIQCALDLSEAGFYVYLIEESHTLGGTMARLDKTFPTNDCSTCMFSPKLVQVDADPNVKIVTGARVQELQGDPGNFRLRIELQPRYVNVEKCIACGQCAEKCPKKVPDEFNGSLGLRRAAFLPFPQAVPRKYALDPDQCLYLTRGRCGLCRKICPTEAVEFDQKPEEVELDTGAVVLAGGFEPALNVDGGEYGFGRFRNVVSSLQYERMLSATGPGGGHVQRPSDGQPPQKVAWIQCVLSRDTARNRPFCSSVCCMHAVKQAVLTRSHEPGSETTIYFMDIRAHGKGFDEYVESARHRHGVRFHRSMISRVDLNPETENLVIETFDHHRNCKVEDEYELVVLSSGLKPTEGWNDLCRRLGVPANPYGFLPADFDRPVSTYRPGVFVCGGLEAPKDIPETVIQAGAAAAEASVLIHTARDTATVTAEMPEEKALEAEPRVGVFVCHCGSNIAGVVDIPSLMEQMQALPTVAFAENFLFSCSTETQTDLAQKIEKHRLNRVVVAACSPKTHEPLFQETLRRAGLNPYLFEMVNIRNQCSWVHGADPAAATAKAAGLIRAGVSRALRLEPLSDRSYAVESRALVIGGGVAGMSAALTMADQGYPVHLVEKEVRLGGFARNLTETLEGDSPPKLALQLAERVARHPRIQTHLDSRLQAHDGQVGSFEGVIQGPDEAQQTLRYGAVVVATGGRPYEPVEYRYGQDPRVLTQVELSRRIREDSRWAAGLRRVVMIQCVGSRNADFPFCSRVCCSAAVKNALALKAANPGVQVVVLYRDLRTFGFKELYYLEARRKGVLFFRYIPEEAPKVYEGENGSLMVDFIDRSSHQPFQVEPDLVVLSSGIRANAGAEPLAKLLKLPRGEEGFFMEAHVKLRPLDFASPGIYLAGLAHSPRFVPEALAMAKGAAQQAVKVLSRKQMRVPATVAEVAPDRCASCLACVRLCPYDAPFINAEGVSEIPPPKCRGCGICVSECPARAITLKHSTDDQIESKIDALLEAGLEH
jgi:heterodisulfide reductase subunit A